MSDIPEYLAFVTESEVIEQTPFAFLFDYVDTSCELPP